MSEEKVAEVTTDIAALSLTGAEEGDTEKLQCTIIRKCTPEEFQSAVKAIEATLSQDSEIELYHRLVNLKNRIGEYENIDKIELPTTLSAGDRKLAHSLADILGLDHFSKGKGNKRFLTCKRKSTSTEGSSNITETMYIAGYMALKGLCIDATASSALNRVPKSYPKARVRRDGTNHHVTLLTPAEFTQILDNLQEQEHLTEEKASLKILEQAKSVEDDWVDLGFGRVEEVIENSSEINEAFFKIVNWPGGDKFRVKFNLPPHDFHITIGFKNNDIHGVKKDYTTLVKDTI